MREKKSGCDGIPEAAAVDSNNNVSSNVIVVVVEIAPEDCIVATRLACTKCVRACVRCRRALAACLPRLLFLALLYLALFDNRREAEKQTDRQRGHTLSHTHAAAAIGLVHVVVGKKERKESGMTTVRRRCQGAVMTRCAVRRFVVLSLNLSEREAGGMSVCVHGNCLQTTFTYRCICSDNVAAHAVETLSSLHGVCVDRYTHK